MRWNKEERKQDNMLRHSVDGSQWRKVDRTFPTFANDARNIRFGLSTDGMNIDVYLKPLIEDLLLLWKEEGVRMWDAHAEEHFNLVHCFS